MPRALSLSYQAIIVLVLLFVVVVSLSLARAFSSHVTFTYVLRGTPRARFPRASLRRFQTGRNLPDRPRRRCRHFVVVVVVVVVVALSSSLAVVVALCCCRRGGGGRLLFGAVARLVGFDDV